MSDEESDEDEESEAQQTITMRFRRSGKVWKRRIPSHRRNQHRLSRYFSALLELMNTVVARLDRFRHQQEAELSPSSPLDDSAKAAYDDATLCQDAERLLDASGLMD
ncbi:hypothetical protein MBANPS3_006837 [Mucor bainieri]